MIKGLRVAGQAAIYTVFITIIGYLSTAPEYVQLPPGQAVIKLSVVHHGRPLGECRERSDEELARLAPNMRVRMVCPRERSPVAVKLELDGVTLYQDILPPSGVKRDGTSTTYQRFTVTAGRHQLRVRLKDDLHEGSNTEQTGAAGGRIDDYTYDNEQELDLQPAQVLVIATDLEAGGFVIK